MKCSKCGSILKKGQTVCDFCGKSIKEKKEKIELPKTKMEFENTKVKDNYNILIVAFILLIITLGIFLGFHLNVLNRAKIHVKKELETTAEVNDKKSDELISLIYPIMLNNNETIVTVNFVCEMQDDEYHIIGKIKDNLVYERVYEQSELENYFNEDTIKEDFNENNFKIIKGLDNIDYLIVIGDGIVDDYINIYNEALDLITKKINQMNLSDLKDDEEYLFINRGYNSIKELENNATLYPDTFNVTYNNIYSKNIYSKIEDNKIYTLMPKDDYTKLEERVYTINYNILTYEVINIYNVLNLEYVTN